jgi:hypothetical protein
MMRWIVRALTFLWGNRQEIAQQAEELIDPQEPPQPLSHRDVEHIQRQIAAGARPPPRKPPRDDRHGGDDDPTRLTWAYYDQLCRFAVEHGTRHNEDTAAHIDRLRVKIVALHGERPEPASKPR